MAKRVADLLVDVLVEAGVKLAAGSEARLAGSLVVCAGSCGPGNMHLLRSRYVLPTTSDTVLRVPRPD